MTSTNRADSSFHLCCLCLLCCKRLIIDCMMNQKPTLLKATLWNSTYYVQWESLSQTLFISNYLLSCNPFQKLSYSLFWLFFTSHYLPQKVPVSFTVLLSVIYYWNFSCLPVTKLSIRQTARAGSKGVQLR